MKNQNHLQITALKNLIFAELKDYIDRDYVLLDVPDYDNIGDNLIWEGELEFLKNFKFNKLYEASYLFQMQKKIPSNALILMQGGGNFGDIYLKTQQERLKIIRNNLEKRILIFPQTLHYQNKENIKKDAEIINQHPDLILCVRDVPSQDLAKDYFPNAIIKLLPDMAFCIDPDRFFHPKGDPNKNLLLKRRDGELGEIPEIPSKSDILDWPPFNLSKEERWAKIQRDRRLDKIAKKLQEFFLFRSFVDSKYGIKGRNRREKYIQMGVEFFQPYEKIYTTRLHGLILGILMGKEMIVLDNSYGKLSNFSNQWLNDFENVRILKS